MRKEARIKKLNNIQSKLKAAGFDLTIDDCKVCLRLLHRAKHANQLELMTVVEGRPELAEILELYLHAKEIA